MLLEIMIVLLQRKMKQLCSSNYVYNIIGTGDYRYFCLFTKSSFSHISQHIFRYVGTIYVACDYRWSFQIRMIESSTRRIASWNLFLQNANIFSCYFTVAQELRSLLAETRPGTAKQILWKIPFMLKQLTLYSRHQAVSASSKSTTITQVSSALVFTYASLCRSVKFYISSIFLLQALKSLLNQQSWF